MRAAASFGLRESPPVTPTAVAPIPVSRTSASTLAAELLQSEIRRMSVESDRIGGINMSQGICDMPIPGPVQCGAQEAIAAGVNQYTRYDGLEELRTAIAAMMLAFNGIEVDPETEVVVSAGSTGAFHSACLALLEPGDEVLLFEPYYGYHATTLRAAGAVPVAVPMNPRGWTIDEEAVGRALRLLQDLQHHGLAHRIRRGSSPLDAAHRPRERRSLCLCAGAAAGRRRPRHPGLARVVLRGPEHHVCVETRPLLCGPDEGRPRTACPAGGLLRARRRHPGSRANGMGQGDAHSRKNRRCLRARERLLLGAVQ
mgnify:CR=1 FL=1